MQPRKYVRYGDLRTASLLFADDVALLASLNCDPHDAAKCEMVWSQHLQVGDHGGMAAVPIERVLNLQSTEQNVSVFYKCSR